MDSENLVTLIKDDIKISSSKAIRYCALEINYQDENGDTPLHWVIRKNQYENFINLLKNNYLDINIINQKGWTLLIEAVNNDNYKFTNIILNNKKFKLINYKDINNNSCLHYALILENEKIALRLLEAKNVDINITNCKGYSILTWAAYNQKDLVVSEIIKKYKAAILSQVDLNTTNTIFFLYHYKKWELLLTLISILPNNSLKFVENIFIIKKIIDVQQWDIAQTLIEKIVDSLINFTDSNHCYSFLNWLISISKWRFLKIFMKKVKLEILNGYHQYLIFLKLIENSKWDLIEILIQKVEIKLLDEFQSINILEGIVCNKKWIPCGEFLNKLLPDSLGTNYSEYSTKLLHLLLFSEKWDFALQLIEKLTINCFGVNDFFYKCPILFLAIAYNNEEVGIKILNKLDEELLIYNITDEYQCLHLAIAAKLFKLSKNIIDRLSIPSLDSKDSTTSLTPLHLAITSDNEEIALQLINKLPPEKLYPVDIKFNGTPLHFAALSGSVIVATALIEKMPSEALDISDCEGYVPFQIAIKNDEFEIAKQILNKMALKSLIYKNDKCIESPLMTAYNDDDNGEIFADLMQKIICVYGDEKNSSIIYLKILKQNWDYFKEISNQLEWNINELSMCNVDSSNEYILITFQTSQSELNITPNKDLFANLSNSSIKPKSNPNFNSCKLNSPSKNLNLRKINKSGTNSNNKIYSKTDQSKELKIQIKPKNEKVINKNKFKYGQFNCAEIEKSLSHIRLAENKAELYEKQCQEKRKQKFLKTDENIKNINDFLLEFNNPHFSNTEAIEICNKEIAELNELKLKTAWSIKDEIIKICRKSNVDGIGRPAIFIGKIKSNETKILILFGTTKSKAHENVKKILSLKINNDNLQQVTNFYCCNFRIISRNELCGLWDTNKKLIPEEKNIIAKFIASEHLHQLNYN